MRCFHASNDLSTAVITFLSVNGWKSQNSSFDQDAMLTLNGKLSHLVPYCKVISDASLRWVWLTSETKGCFSLVMAALHSRCRHYIFVLWFLLSSSFFFFISSSNLSGRRRVTGCLRYFHTWCGLSENLECRSEMYCTQLARNTGHKKYPSWHHRTTLSGYIFTNKAYIDNRKKTC